VAAKPEGKVLGMPMAQANVGSANLSHKPMAPKVNLMTDPSSIITIIVKENETIRTLYNNYKHHPLTDLVERENLAAAIIKNLSMHLFLEENVLYPNYIALLGETQGKIAEKRSLQENQKLKEYLYEADQIFNVREPSFHSRLEEVMRVFNHHSQEEETDWWELYVMGKGGKKVPFDWIKINEDDTMRVSATTSIATTKGKEHAHSSALWVKPGMILECFWDSQKILDDWYYEHWYGKDFLTNRQGHGGWAVLRIRTDKANPNADWVAKGIWTSINDNLLLADIVRTICPSETLQLKRS